MTDHDHNGQERRHGVDRRQPGLEARIEAAVAKGIAKGGCSPKCCETCDLGKNEHRDHHHWLGTWIKRVDQAGSWVMRTIIVSAVLAVIAWAATGFKIKVGGP